LPASFTPPGTGQLGHVFTGVNTSGLTTIVNNTVYSYSSVSLPPGYYLINCAISLSNSSSINCNGYKLGTGLTLNTLTTPSTSITNSTNISQVFTAGNFIINYTTTVSNTGSSNITVYAAGQFTLSANGTFDLTNTKMYAIRLF